MAMAIDLHRFSRDLEFDRLVLVSHAHRHQSSLLDDDS